MKANFARVTVETSADGSETFAVTVYRDANNKLVIPCQGETEASALLYAIKINSSICIY